MLFKSFSAAFLASVSLFASPVKADELPAIEIVGSKFFYSNNGSQFYMKGIAYQQEATNLTKGHTFKDPLADAEACARDIPLLAAVHTNTIRVYALNASQDHSACMKLLVDNGIYIIADLSEPDLSIDRSSPTWTVKLFERYTTIIDEFQNYTNVLGFFAGNEVTNDNTNTDASAFVKAAVRDSKAYIKEKGYRQIPVGYSSNDDDDTRLAIADYFVCGDDDDDSKSDFYGINVYSWCGKSTFRESGYDDRTAEFKNLTVPIFFSEYGCNEVTPRLFTEVQSLYGDDMTDHWSGGLVYMYFQEANNYGLVSIDSSGDAKTLEDYDNYSKEMQTISPTSAHSDDVTTASTTVACPTQDSNWKAATNLPPTPDQGLCDCMLESLTCVVSDEVDSEDYGDLFGVLCGEISCEGISANGTTGEYGAYSPCSSKEQLSYLLNLYYLENGSRSSDCDFDGSATTKAASTASTCSTALSEAGSSGIGSVSRTVSIASGSGANSGSNRDSSASGSSSRSSSSGDSSSSANTVRAPFVADKLFIYMIATLVIGGLTAILI